MIYCTSFEEVDAHLKSIGFSQVARYEGTIRYARRGDLMTVRAPNLNGHVPEALINDAFYVAGLAPPDWTVFWCD